MATNRDLLKEAIADAKAVKEMAIANAKAALEEAFTPQLKTMLSAKLHEMELEEEELQEEDSDLSMDPDGPTAHGNVKEDEDDEIAEVDLEELLAELAEEEEKMDETEINESEITEEEMKDESRAERADVDKYEYEKGKEAGEDEGEALDLEDMTDDDLKKFIEDVIADMVESGELEAGEGAEEEEGEDVDVDVDVDVEDEEEVDLAELLKEIEGMEEDMKYEKPVDEAKEKSEEETKEDVKDILDLAGDVLKENSLNEIILENLSAEEIGKKVEDLVPELEKKIKQKGLQSKALGVAGAIAAAALMYKMGVDYQTAQTVVDHVTLGVPASTILAALGTIIGFGGSIRKSMSKFKDEQELSKVKEELDESYDTIKILKKELNEINLLNAKLLYTNKIFRSKNLTESQKVKVLGSFDNATTVKETKLVFETLNEGIKVKKPSVEKTLGRASKSTNTPTTKKPIVESNDAYLRMQKLAGLI
jgi:hypothetical protein